MTELLDQPNILLTITSDIKSQGGLSDIMSNASMGKAQVVKVVIDRINVPKIHKSMPNRYDRTRSSVSKFSVQSVWAHNGVLL